LLQENILFNSSIFFNANLTQERRKTIKNLKKITENFVGIKKGSIFALAKRGITTAIQANV